MQRAVWTELTLDERVAMSASEGNPMCNYLALNRRERRQAHAVLYDGMKNGYHLQCTGFRRFLWTPRKHIRMDCRAIAAQETQTRGLIAVPSGICRTVRRPNLRTRFLPEDAPIREHELKHHIRANITYLGGKVILQNTRTIRHPAEVASFHTLFGHTIVGTIPKGLDEINLPAVNPPLRHASVSAGNADRAHGTYGPPPRAYA